MSLATKALLVSLNITLFAGRKRDENASNTVETAHATQGKIGNFNKQLLPGAQELADVIAMGGSIRKYFHSQTLPWKHDGTRIISAKNYMDFCNEFAKQKSDFDAAVNSFLMAYPTLKAHAQSRLGSLFNDADYPSPAEILEKFTCELDFEPLREANDFRVEISDSHQKAAEEKFKKAESKAMREAWERLFSVAKKAAEKLNDPNAQFKEATIANILELCALLPKLNITDDPELEARRVELEAVANSIDADTCRKNPEAREAAAASLNEITDKMAAFMGSI